MTSRTRQAFRGLATVLGLVMVACASTDSATGQPQSSTAAKPGMESAKAPATAAEAEAYAEFRKRVEAYLDIHKQAQQKAPRRSTEATPEAIDRHQRALGQAIQQARATAKRGDIFTPEAETAMKAILRRVFGGPEGKQLKASIMDENPGAVKLSINGRYPDEVPLSTVPPQVLASLPKLPPEIEYRFVGDRLVLLDVQAHLIIDYIDAALP